MTGTPCPAACQLKRIETETHAQLFDPLHPQRSGGYDQYMRIRCASERFGDHQPRLNGFAETDRIGQQKARRVPVQERDGRFQLKR